MSDTQGPNQPQEPHVPAAQPSPQQSVQSQQQPYLEVPPGYQASQPPFGYAQGQTPPPATNSKAITSLVLGILGIIFCPLVCSIPAWVIAKQAKGELAAQPYQNGHSEAQIGYILGIVGTVLGTILAVLMIFLFVMPPFAVYLPTP